jgi:flagellar hook-basal body complex protein FliE
VNLRIDSSAISATGGASVERLDRMDRTIEPAGSDKAKSFGSELGKAIGEIDKLQTEADLQSDAVARGAGNIHEMALALEKADVAMRLAMRVRNKLVDTYNEIMRMGI